MSDYRELLLSEVLDGIIWSGKQRKPRVGDQVNVTINGIGQGMVVGHFTECGYLGVKVKPFNPPKWYINQNGKDAVCHVFGAELGDV